jgi:hypothetical protein
MGTTLEESVTSIAGRRRARPLAVVDNVEGVAHFSDDLFESPSPMAPETVDGVRP